MIDLVTMELAAYLAITLFLVQSVKDALSSSDALFYILTSRSAHLPYVHAKLLQLCQTLCDTMDCSPPVSSVHGILQA